MRIVATTLLWLCAVTAQAAEIEIFLTQDMEVTGIENAHEAGHTLSWIYLDQTVRLEQQLSQAFSQALQQELAGLDGDSDATAQIVERFNDRSDPQIRAKLKALVTDDFKQQLASAWRNVIRAKQLGIRPEQLPVVRFNGQNYAQINDLGVLFGGSE